MTGDREPARCFMIDEDRSCRHCGAVMRDQTIAHCYKCGRSWGDPTEAEREEAVVAELMIYRMIMRGELP